MRQHTTSSAPTRSLATLSKFSTRRRSRHLIGLGAAALFALAGCAVPAATTGEDHTDQALSHVHGVVADPAGDGFLLGTHDGIFPATPTGELGTRIAGSDFDAMGLTVVDGTLLASGHPGANTPVELGTPNLGIIRSTDRAETWEAVAFTGEKDFHALTAGPDGTVYGLSTDSTQLQISTDLGTTWNATGAALVAVSFAVDTAGRIVAATPDGLQVSTDDAATFALWSNAPLLFMLNASPDHQRLVGVGNGGKIWVTTAGATQWTEAGTVHGTAQAIAITNAGDMLIVDDSGITQVPQK